MFKNIVFLISMLARKLKTDDFYLKVFFKLILTLLILFPIYPWKIAKYFEISLATLNQKTMQTVSFFTKATR